MLNLNLKNITALKVTKTLRDLQPGDVILADTNGTIMDVVDKDTYKLLLNLADKSQTAKTNPRTSNKSSPEARARFNNIYTKEQLHNILLSRLTERGPMTTGDMVTSIFGDTREHAATNLVGHNLLHLQNQAGTVTSTSIEGKNRRGRTAILTLWDLKTRSIQPNGI
jgi:hypothetical protein